jgi:hypothetical protein
VLPVLQHRPHTSPNAIPDAIPNTISNTVSNTVSNAIPDPTASCHWLWQLVGQLRQEGMEFGAWRHDRNLSQLLQFLVLHRGSSVRSHWSGFLLPRELVGKLRQEGMVDLQQWLFHEWDLP